MSGWRQTREHPLHTEVFSFVDDVQGMRVDRVVWWRRTGGCGVSKATGPVWAK